MFSMHRNRLTNSTQNTRPIISMWPKFQTFAFAQKKFVEFKILSKNQKRIPLCPTDVIRNKRQSNET